MLYNKRSHIRPSNTGRQTLVERMSGEYEQAARDRQTNAVNAANYEITLYQIMGTGVTCTCRLDATGSSILAPDGSMTDTAMAAILAGRPTPDAIPINRNPEETFYMDDYADDDVEDEDEEDEPTLRDSDIDNDDVMISYDTDSGYNPTSTNCGVCNRVGIVGGYNRYGGARHVYAVPHFLKTNEMEDAAINYDKAPNSVVPINADAAIEFDIQLLKDPHRIETLRLMNQHQPLNYGTDYQLFLVDGSDLIEVANKDTLRAYSDGQWHRVQIQFTKEFTHFEVTFIINPVPLKVDVTNWSLVANSETLNDYDSLTVVLPPQVERIKRGDIFFSKQLKVPFIVTGAESLSSAIKHHGFTVTAERVKGSYDLFSLANPYVKGQ